MTTQQASSSVHDAPFPSPLNQVHQVSVNNGQYYRQFSIFLTICRKTPKSYATRPGEFEVHMMLLLLQPCQTLQQTKKTQMTMHHSPPNPLILWCIHTVVVQVHSCQPIFLVCSVLYYQNCSNMYVYIHVYSIFVCIFGNKNCENKRLKRS